MRKVSGKLRLDLSQYRELKVFAQFGADLDESTMRTLEQGKRTNEILKQDVHEPMSVEHQIVLLYMTTKELLRGIPVERVAEFKDEFIKFLDIGQADPPDNGRDGNDIRFQNAQEPRTLRRESYLLRYAR